MQILLLKKSAVAHKNIHTQRQRIRADQHSIALYDTKQSQEKQNKAGVVLHGMAWHGMKCYCFLDQFLSVYTDYCLLLTVYRNCESSSEYLSAFQ